MKIFFKKLLVTGFGTGYIPVLPGSCGTLIGVLIYILLGKYPVILYLLIIFLFIYGVKLSTWAEGYFKEKDSRKIVIDEIVGYLITMSNIRMIYTIEDMKFYVVLIIAFGLFRFFDGLKPFYIKKAEELKGGLGIMLDDVLAGIYSNIILIIIIYYFIK